MPVVDDDALTTPVTKLAPKAKPRNGGGPHKHRRWRLSGNKKPHIDVVRNDINVTPLVDVMLVLLIIFMLMTLIMGRGHDVKLPGGRNFSQEKDKMQPVITVDLEGEEAILYFEKERIGPLSEEAKLKEMGSRVEAAWAVPKNKEGANRVYLKANTQVPYGKMYPLLKYLHESSLSLDTIDLAIAKEAGEK
ncbi:MAG: Biopolymer transport protein ExbD/TolR [Myxococcales bacterium]|nr:Biopolymer transport protein ExbD/TolR [Myxococcales bacterium]